MPITRAARLNLWTINRWLRWTGFRLFVAQDSQGTLSLGITFFGLPGSKGWRAIEGGP